MVMVKPDIRKARTSWRVKAPHVRDGTDLIAVAVNACGLRMSVRKAR